MEKLFWPITVIGVCVVLLAVYNVFKAVIRKGNVPGRQDELEKRPVRNREKKVNDEAGVLLRESSSENTDEAETENVKTENVSDTKPAACEAETQNAFRKLKSDLWQRWCLQTGNWNMDMQQVIAFARTLTPLQLEVLLSVYRNDHPDLYRGVISDPVWRKRCADPLAEFVGGRIEVLKKAYSAAIPADPLRLWNWWLEKTNKSKGADVLRHVMCFMERTQIETVRKQLELHVPSCDKHCTPESGLKNPDEFYRVQLTAVKAFLKAKK